MKSHEFLRLTRNLLLASTALAVPGLAHADPNIPLPTGQFITPLAPAGAMQQFLNPGLQTHPQFIAGEAVRARLSPDGNTLAIICAGQNTLYTPVTGTVEPANSTQYIFLY